MSDFQQSGVAAVVAVVVSLTVISIFARKSRRLTTPPGPKSSWFGFGKPPVPTTYPWRTYQEWQRLYGDIVFYYAYGNPIVVLNSAKVADELLDKRGAIYSSRPVRTMLRELMGWNWSFSNMLYGSSWRKYRSTFQKHFHPRAITQYQPIQLKEVQTFLRNLNRSPEDFYHHMRRNAAALVMKISYDHDIAEEGDHFVGLADRAMTGTAQAAIFGTFVVDYLPILKHVPSWFPGAEFKRKAKVWRQDTVAMLEEPFAMVKQKMALGTAGPCVTTLELDDASKEKEIDVSMIQGVAAISYAAGADTTVSAVMSFFIAMMNNPEIQRKAQEEIDQVVGNDRLPTFEDRSRMPFLTCLVWETLRWNPVTPLAVPHATVQDDVYEGYLIPKGTTVLANAWAILHDEAKYPDPFSFNPERFADEKKNAELEINELPYAAFGFGRRICPGRWLALDTIWITIASVLAVYNISKPKDANGAVIEQAVVYTGHAISRPEPFKCTVVPRSAEVLALVGQA